LWLSAINAIGRILESRVVSMFTPCYWKREWVTGSTSEKVKK
jgi:hypothetical protein